MKKSFRAVALLLTVLMVFGLFAGCGETAETTPAAAEQTPASETAASETEPAEEIIPWDGAYMEEDDYKAYIEYDLTTMVEGIADQLTADEKTAVEAAQAAGNEAIEAAHSVAAVLAAYNDAYNAILDCIPTYDGIISYASASYDEKGVILGNMERYAVATGITGLSLFENGGYVMYNPRITLGTENYIVGYGFGTLAEGSITADLEYETNPDWVRYYHTYESEDSGTLNYLNDQGSVVGDLYGYIAASLYTNFMNETKDGYDWVPELAIGDPIAVNPDENGMATTWKFQVRTGAEGLRYTTGSSMESRAAFNNREVALEDYVTPFKLLLTQSNALYRGSELANTNTGAIEGALDYYNATAEGYDEAAWENVGIKVYEEDGKSYFEVTYTEALTMFYARYYISSSLYMPVPQEFIDLVTVQNYLGFNNDATETPVDNSLALGAYYVEDYTSDQQIVYKKNPNYVYADTKYAIEGVHIKIFPAAAEDPTAGIEEFLAGHFDSTGIPQDYLDQYRNDPRTRMTTGDSNFKLNINALDQETWNYMFGENGVVTQTDPADYWECKPCLSNSHFRKAISYSIDRISFANARGCIPSVDYLSSNYMIDPENGIAYSSTEAHKKAVETLLTGTDEGGYSLELARDYFRAALTELEAEGAYTPGTKENPTVITLEIAWMYTTHEESYHNEIKNFLETAFNDDSVSGGVYQLNVEFWCGNAWDEGYDRMMVGSFDIGFGSISGNSLDPLGFFSVLSSDQSISQSFTLNWAVDTNDPDAYPLVYNGYRWSFDALYTAGTSTAIVSNGANETALSFEYNGITENEDGSYTGSFTVYAALPDATEFVAETVACCNYERYYYGDGNYDETYLDPTTEDDGNGVYTVTFEVPAELAADYATGSGTSPDAGGYTGFDLYYWTSLDGNESESYYSVDDFFNVE